LSETVAITRSIDEIGASLRLNMMDMVNRAIAIGQDLIDAKELLGHGNFMPWLKKFGISTSTASNYMRVAREITPGSRLSTLPYSKALALLAAPADEREELAEKADDKSAAEIRKLIEERNRAAEAANAETVRADQAERDAKEFNQENAALRVQLQNKEEQYKKEIFGLRNEANKQRQYAESLKEELEKKRADLLIAENNRVEVEVPPADYEDLKRTQAELLAAAEDAEKRAADAEAELEMLRNQGGGDESEPWKVLKVAVTRFMADCEMMPAEPARLIPDENRITACLSRIEKWTDMMRMALASGVKAEGAVE
jgi:hypothetical protein